MNPPAATDAPETFWFHRHRAERQSAADAYAGYALDTLGLTPRAHNGLRRSRRYPDIGALILAGEEIWTVRNLGVVSIRELETRPVAGSREKVVRWRGPVPRDR